MKLDILMHYNVDETTGEVTFIGKEEIKVDTAVKTTKSIKKSTTTKSLVDESEPIITLEANKLVLTQGAVDLLGVCADCRIDIKYKKKDKQSVPVIGTDQAFGTKAGNKLTKSNTISYRGAANEKLAQYGESFTMEPTEDQGIYYLIGNKVLGEPDIPEEITNIESELDIINMEDVEEQDLENFDFNL